MYRYQNKHQLSWRINWQCIEDNAQCHVAKPLCFAMLAPYILHCNLFCFSETHSIIFIVLYSIFHQKLYCTGNWSHFNKEITMQLSSSSYKHVIYHCWKWWRWYVDFDWLKDHCDQYQSVYNDNDCNVENVLSPITISWLI